MYRYLHLLIILLTLVATPALAEEAATEPEQKPKKEYDTYELLNLFGEVFDRVREDYVEAPDDKELIENAINGMLSSLDPHSGYLNEEDFKDMQVQTKGEFGGLGIEVTMENGLVKVVSPIDDTPAYKAGVQAGDLISQIDGEPVMGLTLREAVKLMRGKPGAKIDIRILREDEAEPLEVTIIRDIIRIQSVKSRVEGDVGYLRITSFSGQTSRNLKKHLKEITEEIGEDKIKGYVLDLRNNPGGLLTQAIEVTDVFLQQGEIVSTRSRVRDENKPDINAKRYNASKGDLSDGKPVIVLINGGSASASEIVAGALQDHKRAVVMGTKSFGKGSVQTVVPVSSNGAMRLTTARYYTPSGRSIQATGIEPDILVEQAKIEFADNKNKRSEAGLKNSLKNEQDGSHKKASAKARDKEEKDDKTDNKYKEDFQLARALDLINALAIIK